ncbi:hypothetical protein BDZ85DRAFT_247344 [Elsinoe ampelina]|uniref:Uncharacterized protein n=1 Tax=Elsinoe ampelina TaxID=302913 RepID=A0A6A6GNR8_9PEZI|nr:hypothetical protein BDZ85DRAFT_247344 [Elsinoe ampelina]
MTRQQVSDRIFEDCLRQARCSKARRLLERTGSIFDPDKRHCDDPDLTRWVRALPSDFRDANLQLSSDHQLRPIAGDQRGSISAALKSDFGVLGCALRRSSILRKDSAIDPFQFQSRELPPTQSGAVPQYFADQLGEPRSSPPRRSLFRPPSPSTSIRSTQRPPEYPAQSEDVTSTGPRNSEQPLVLDE